MLFSKDYEFRYSDLSVNGKIKTSTIIDLLQDISISHADYAGLGTEKMSSISVACLLEGWRIRFDKPLSTNEKVTVKTGIMNISKFETLRKYEIWQNNECKIIATAVWFTVNTERMRVTPAPQEFFTMFEKTNEDDNEFPYVKIRPEKDCIHIKNTKVEIRDLDTNNHMNNVKSVEVMLNSLPEDFDISELQVKYRKELKKDEIIEMWCKKSNKDYYCEIKNSEGQTCVMVWIKTKNKE